MKRPNKDNEETTKKSINASAQMIVDRLQKHPESYIFISAVKDDMGTMVSVTNYSQAVAIVKELREVADKLEAQI